MTGQPRIVQMGTADSEDALARAIRAEERLRELVRRHQGYEGWQTVDVDAFRYVLGALQEAQRRERQHRAGLPGGRAYREEAG